MGDRLTCPAKFMPHLYILKNDTDNYYTGITALKPEQRLERHNRGDVFSTKHKGQWRLIYTEFFQTMLEARKKEKLIKSWKGGNAFKVFVSKAARSSNGRTSDSESEYLGSNPSLAALERKNKFGGVK